MSLAELGPKLTLVLSVAPDRSLAEERQTVACKALA